MARLPIGGLEVFLAIAKHGSLRRAAEALGVQSPAVGEHIRDDMIAVRLSPPLKEVVFAAPSYFDKHGRPKQPKELLRHNCIRYRYIASMRFEAFMDGDLIAQKRFELVD